MSCRAHASLASSSLHCPPLLEEPKSAGCSSDDAETLVDVLLATKDSEAAAAALRQLKDASLIEKYLAQSTLFLAGRICGDEIEHFAVVTKALLAADERIDDLENTGKRLLDHWKKLPARELRSAVLGGHLAALCATVLKGEIIRHAGGRAPAPQEPVPAARTPQWARRFPKELRPALRYLQGCDSEAQNTAARILSKDFPDPEKIKRQIEALEARIAENPRATLAVRLKKLKAWEMQPVTVGAGRLVNLETKLREAATRATVADWQRRVEDEFRIRLPHFLGSETLPEWAEDMKVLELLLPIGGLSTSFQKLVAEILKHRSAPPPWDLRDVGENRRFISKMNKRGISMSAWLDEAPVLKRTVAGNKVTFTLERDPIEVFAMGGHFKTCLSPGSFNYFSAFANAADVNKQVLYGRREDGQVLARCLLALSGTGGIITFHPYCHDKALDFTEVVKEYIKGLARSMNTAVVARGAVPKLLAPDWYDDGPVDVTEQFAFLKNKDFLRSLEETPLEQVSELLSSAVAPLSLDELTLPMLVWHEAFTRRPELILPLYPIVLHNERLASDLILHVVEMLNRLGRFHEAERLSPRLLAHALAAHRDGYEYVANNVIDALARCAPTRALHLLKKTRPKGVRNWKQDNNGYRLYAGAMANLKLHRPTKARRLLENAIGNPCCNNHHKKLCQRLLEEITRD